MPAPKFESDGITPRVTLGDRLLTEFGQLSPDELQAGINLSEIRVKIEEIIQRPIAWGGLYKAYQKLKRDEAQGRLPDGVVIPSLQETHSRQTRSEVVRLRRAGFTHDEVADKLGISRGRSLSVASQEGASTKQKEITKEEKDKFVDAWEKQGLKSSQVREVMGISEGRFDYMRSLLIEEGRISKRGPDMVEMGVRNGIILTLAKQGYTPADTQQILRDTYGYEVDVEKIYGMLRDYRSAGKLPKFASRSELYAWRDKQRRTHGKESMQVHREIIAQLEKQIEGLLAKGGAIIFNTDRMGAEVFNVSVIANPNIAEDVKVQTGIRSTPLTYIREDNNGAVQGKLIFDSRVASFLYDKNSNMLRVDRSQHGRLLLRTLELLRTNIVLDVINTFHIDMLAEEEIPTIADIFKKLATS